MSQVLNAKDRNQAFLKFSLFFAATLVLVIIAVYFDYRMPVRENKMLQEEIDQQRQADFNQGKFASTLQDASALLDSLDRPGANPVQINLQLDQKLIDLNTLQEKDNSIYGRIDRVIVYKLLSLSQAKKALQGLSENENKINRMRAELKETRDQLQSAQADLDAYRRAK